MEAIKLTRKPVRLLKRKNRINNFVFSIGMSNDETIKALLFIHIRASAYVCTLCSFHRNNILKSVVFSRKLNLKHIMLDIMSDKVK